MSKSYKYFLLSCADLQLFMSDEISQAVQLQKYFSGWVSEHQSWTGEPAMMQTSSKQPYKICDVLWRGYVPSWK